MYLGRNIWGLVVGDKSIGIQNAFTSEFWDFRTRLRKTFFFGGNNTAPHEMYLTYDNIHYDKPGYQDYFNSRNYMIWNLTEFWSGNNYTFHAYRQIEGSAAKKVTVTSIPEGMERQSCIINNGADITFIAGQRILLHKGFHVKPGGKFHAIIGSKDLYDKSVKDKSINDSFAGPEILEPDCKESKIIDLESDGLKLNSFYSLYPNPSPGIFTLRFNDGQTESYTVEVRNMMGKTVFKKENIRDEATVIDIRNEAKGIYLIKLSAGGKVYSDKMIVQ